MKKTLLGLLVLITAQFTNAQTVDSVTAITTTSQHQFATWNFGPDSIGFTELQIADNPGFSPMAVYPMFQSSMTGQLNYNFTGLNSGTVYYHRLMQSSATLGTIYSPVVTATTDTIFTLPSVLIDSITPVTTTSGKLNCSSNTGGDTLHIHAIVSTTPTFVGGLQSFVDFTVPIGTTIVSVTFTGLISNTQYWTKIESKNRVGTTISGVESFTTLDAGVFSVPVSDSATVTDTTVTIYGSANIADKYWLIHGTDYVSVNFWHIGEIENYTDCGGCVVTSTSATFNADPSTTYYWAFVTEYDGSVNYGTTLSATTLPIDTPILSLSIPIVADTNATAVAFYSSIYSDTMFITYGQPTLGVGTQSTNPVYVESGTGTFTETLHNLIAGTNGQAQLHAIVHGVDVTSPIVSFVTSAPGVVIPFSGYITSVDVDPSLTFATFNFAFISENATASVWIDVGNATDTNYIYPFPGGVPHYLSSTGGIAYDTIVVPYSYSTNHEYICRVNGWNIGNIDAGTGIYTSGSFHFDTYQDGTIGSFYSTPYFPIDNGDNATLHWTTSNVATVTISGIGVVSNNGSISTGPLTETTTFTLTVNGLSGNVVSEEVMVEVNPTVVETIDLVDQMTLVFNDQFSVNFPQAKVVQVYNLSGLKVFESDVFSNISHFNLNQPAGMYLCRTVDAIGIISPAKKIILVH